MNVLKNGLDLIHFYKEYLGDEKPYSAIMGIGEQGNKGNIEKIRQALTLKNESLPKEVVQRILLDLKYVVKR